MANVPGDENDPRHPGASDAPDRGGVPPADDADGLARFLASAPPELQDWARRQAREAGIEPGASGPEADAAATDAAAPAPPTPPAPTGAAPVVELGDPDTNRNALAELGEDDLDDDPILRGRDATTAAPAGASADPAPAPVERPAGPSAPASPGPAAAVTPTAATAATPAPGRAARPSRHTGPPTLPTAPLIHTPSAEQAARPSAGDPVNPYPVAGAQRKRGLSPLVAVVLVILVAVVVVAIQQLGGGGADDAAQSDQTTSGTTASGEAPVDPEAIADLESSLEENPDNTGTMRSLADLYYATGDYANAARWMDEVVQREPGDAAARTFLGVLQFNQGDMTAAEEQWLAAVDADPQYVEAYYNLGFAYLSSDPARTAEAEEAWGRVLEISPNSNLADIVRSHMASLAGDGATEPTDGGGDGP